MFEQDDSALKVRGRLRKDIKFWKEIGASNMILRVIEQGYLLPFVVLPQRASFANHQSAVKNDKFVMQAINDLLSVGSVEEVQSSSLHVISPLGVVPKKNNKLRLILDLRYLNQHLFVKKFKYEDLLVVSQLVSKGDWFVTFDLKNGYHHVDIASAHRTYLGFSFVMDGKVKFFQFASLPFGLATAPYIFKKTLHPLVKYGRGQGKRTVMYIDDGFAVASSQSESLSLANCVRRDLTRCGFLINEDKSNLDPHQYGEYLGYIVDLRVGMFLVPNRKVENLMSLIRNLVVCPSQSVLARSLAQIAGTIISMGLALGHVSRLFTRSIYALINSVPSLKVRVRLSEAVLQELMFWWNNFSSLVGQPIWHLSPRIDVITYSDASSSGWAGYVVQLGSYLARGISMIQGKAPTFVN